MNLKELQNLVEQVWNPVEGLINDPRSIFCLSDSLKDYLTICHPDRFVGDAKNTEQATELSKVISRLHELTKNITKIGDYDVIDTINSGDSSDILVAVKDANGYIIKRGKTPAVRRYLQEEFNIVCDIQKKTAATIYSNLFRKPEINLSDKTNGLTVYKYGRLIPLNKLTLLKTGLDGRPSWNMRSWNWRNPPL